MVVMRCTCRNTTASLELGLIILFTQIRLSCLTRLSLPSFLPSPHKLPSATYRSNLGAEGWRNTWFGLRLQNDKKWSEARIGRFAKDGYDQIIDQAPGQTMIVAALWICNVGVFFESIPHDGSQEFYRSEFAEKATFLWS